MMSMKCIIVTGMSGAGKSTALKFFEDIGFFCVDNLPPMLIPKFIELCNRPSNEITRVALGIDIRGGKLFENLFVALDEIKIEGRNIEILFLESSDDVLLNRFKESRRAHPIARGKRIHDGIDKERNLLKNIKNRSDYIIDTSYILTSQLKEKINDIFLDNKKFGSLMVTILSFGFKYGMPNDADLVFDVRFIPNPFYISELKCLTGNDEPVKKYVLDCNESKTFVCKLNDMIKFLIPNYIKEGKNQIVIAIGCTGGKHRSVAISNELYKELLNLEYSVNITHRDIDKNNKR